MTAPDPSDKALRAHHKRIQGMLDDPALVDDLLLLGIAMARYIDFDPGFKKDPAAKRRSLNDLGAEVLGAANANQLGYHVKGILRSDIRRYDPMNDPGNRAWVCTAPMIRREGRCGQGAGRTEIIVDLDTGKRSWAGACSRHRDWLASVVARNRAALKERDAPIPVANSGGVLAKHLPEVNWEKLWLRLDRKWTPPPEDDPYRRPVFSLLLGDEPEPTEQETRPALAVVRGAGERINIDGAAQ